MAKESRTHTSHHEMETKVDRLKQYDRGIVVWLFRHFLSWRVFYLSSINFNMWIKSILSSGSVIFRYNPNAKKKNLSNFVDAKPQFKIQFISMNVSVIWLWFHMEWKKTLKMPLHSQLLVRQWNESFKKMCVVWLSLTIKKTFIFRIE